MFCVCCNRKDIEQLVLHHWQVVPNGVVFWVNICNSCNAILRTPRGLDNHILPTFQEQIQFVRKHLVNRWCQRCLYLGYIYSLDNTVDVVSSLELLSTGVKELVYNYLERRKAWMKTLRGDWRDVTREKYRNLLGTIGSESFTIPVEAGNVYTPLEYCTETNRGDVVYVKAVFLAIRSCRIGSAGSITPLEFDAQVRRCCKELTDPFTRKTNSAHNNLKAEERKATAQWMKDHPKAVAMVATRMRYYVGKRSTE